MAPLPAKRLDSYAFPVETDVLFIHLVLGAFMWLFGWTPIMGGILTGIWQGHDASFIEIIQSVAWMFGVPLLFAVLTILLFLWHPTRLIRNQHLKPFDSATDPAFAREIKALTERAHLHSPFSVMLRKNNQLDGQAFGLPRHFVLRLDEGLRIALRRAPDKMRAVTLHELAHLFNRDVTRTYFAQALWLTLFSAFFVPYLIIFLLGLLRPRLQFAAQGALTSEMVRQTLFEALPGYGFMILHLLFGMLIILALRAALLRARETYADWRVVEWGEGDGLANLLQSAATASPPNFQTRFLAYLRLHPTTAERLATVRDPMRLFQGSSGLPFFAGWLTTISLVGFALYYLNFLGGWMEAYQDWRMSILQGLPILVQLLMGHLTFFFFLVLFVAFAMAPVLLFGYTIMGSLGNTIQRRAVADAFQGKRGVKPYLGLLGPASLFVLGLYAGEFMNLELLISYSVSDLWMFWLAFPAFVGGVCLCLCLIRFMSIRILGAAIGSKPPKWRRRALSGLTILLFGVFLLVFFYFLLISSSSASENGQPTLTTDPKTIQSFTRILTLTIMSGLCLSFGFFVGVPITLAMWRSIRPLHCPRCNAVIHEKIVLGKTCPNCQSELSAWALVQSRPPLNT